MAPTEMATKSNQRGNIAPTRSWTVDATAIFPRMRCNSLCGHSCLKCDGCRRRVHYPCAKIDPAGGKDIDSNNVLYICDSCNPQDAGKTSSAAGNILEELNSLKVRVQDLEQREPAFDEEKMKTMISAVVSDVLKPSLQQFKEDLERDLKMQQPTLQQFKDDFKEKLQKDSKRLTLVMSKAVSLDDDGIMGQAHQDNDSPPIQTTQPGMLHVPTFDVSNPVELKRTQGFNHPVKLETPGQGTVAFNVRPLNVDTGDFKILLMDIYGKTVIKVVISNRDVHLSGAHGGHFKKVITKPFHFNLMKFQASNRYVWVSIDKSNCIIKFGVGYMMELNTLFSFPHIDGLEEKAEEAIRRIRSIQITDIKLYSQPKYWRLPIVVDPPVAIVSTNEFTIDHISKNNAIPPICLPLEAQRLYGFVAGQEVKISAEDIEAINYSLDTPGCALNEKLSQKAAALGNCRATYIRVTIGSDRGDSTGVPFVLEIWPKGHGSPVHGHGNSVAVIKVLHGSLVCNWYNPLAKWSEERPQMILSLPFEKGDITWMTPEFYQTHRLLNYRQDTMTATLQCYGFLGSDTSHREAFDYVTDADSQLHMFRPKSDFTFDEMITLVRRELASRPRRMNSYGFNSQRTA